MSSFLRYLVSAKNLLGVALALVGLVLYLFGLFGPFWPLVVAGLYAVGALIGPRRRPKVARASFDPQVVRKAVDRAYQMTHGRLPTDVQSRVAQIRQEILEQCLGETLRVIDSLRISLGTVGPRKESGNRQMAVSAFFI